MLLWLSVVMEENAELTVKQTVIHTQEKNDGKFSGIKKCVQAKVRTLVLIVGSSMKDLDYNCCIH